MTKLLLVGQCLLSLSTGKFVKISTIEPKFYTVVELQDSELRGGLGTIKTWNTVDYVVPKTGLARRYEQVACPIRQNEGADGCKGELILTNLEPKNCPYGGKVLNEYVCDKLEKTIEVCKDASWWRRFVGRVF